MIGGIIKYFRFTYDYAMWGISYSNLLMLLATIPSYDSEEDKKQKVEKQIEDPHEMANYINNLKWQ